MKEKKIIGISQHRFMNGETCLTSLTVFYEEMLSSTDEVRTRVVICLNFRTAFDTVIVTFPLTKL